MTTVIALLIAAVVVGVWTYRQYCKYRRKNGITEDYEWLSEQDFWGDR